MHTCGPHGTCVDGVNSYSCDCDPGFQETDIDVDEVCENLDDCGDCSRDASEKLVQAVNVERLVLNIFVGESGEKFVVLQKRGAFPRHDHHICFDSDSWKIAERSSPNLYDGVDHERWSVFECTEFCKETELLTRQPWRAVQMSI